MKGFRHGHKAKVEKCIAISLAVVGFLIIINTMPVRFLLLLIGIGLLLMGALIFMK